MRTRYTIGGEMDLTLPVEVYDVRLGIFYDVDVEVFNVPVTGSSSYTPATYHDPPESDGEVRADLGPFQAADLIEETDDGELEAEGLLLTESPEEWLRIIDEKVEERYADDPSRWESEDD